eukprot:m.9548 g.9548  ORF g.9548 m.9548 type:complete len:381 (+) comp21428_c0_seq2:67-1209(+)
MSDVRVLTFNCWGVFFFSSKRRERIKHIAEKLAEGKHDVIALQEIWCKEDYELLATKLASEYPYAHYFRRSVVSSGLCTFSRWPIIQVTFYPFDLSENHLPCGAKGWGLTVIDHPQNGPLHVINTHLTWIPPYCRAPQVLQLHQFIQAVKPQHLFLCGDFNSLPTGSEYKALTGATGLVDSWLECHAESTDGLTCGRLENIYREKNDGADRLDYIFYRSSCDSGERLQCTGAKVTMGEIPGTDIFYSDHNALEAEFKFVSNIKEERKSQDSSESLAGVMETVFSSLEAAQRRRQWQFVMSFLLLLIWVACCILKLSSGFLNLPCAGGLMSLVLAYWLFDVLHNFCLVAALSFGIYAMFITGGEVHFLTELRNEIRVGKGN